MHRKRVTCELHDSYFRLMTIKHAIPKILSGRLNYYITRWRQEVREFGDQTSWREDAGMRTCPREAGPPAALENENDTRLCPEGLERSICCSSVRSPTPSHTQTFQIKWEVYFFKEVFARLLLCVVMILHIYAYDYTTFGFWDQIDRFKNYSYSMEVMVKKIF